MTPKRKPAALQTVSDMAREWGISEQAFRRHLRREGIKAEPGTRGLYDPEPIVDMMEAVEERIRQRAEGRELSPLEARKLDLQCEMLRLRIAKERGDFRADAQSEAKRAAVQFAAMVRRAFQSTALDLAPKVAATPADVPRVADIIQAELDGAMRMLEPAPQGAA